MGPFVPDCGGREYSGLTARDRCSQAVAQGGGRQIPGGLIRIARFFERTRSSLRDGRVFFCAEAPFAPLVYLRPFDGSWASRARRITPVKNLREGQHSCLFFCLWSEHNQ